MAEQDRPIGEVVGQLIDDGKAYAKSEVDLARVRALMFVERYRSAAIFAAVALMFSIGAFVALAVTAVLSLASLIGPLAGGLAATLLIGGIAGVLAYLARERFLRGDE